MILYTSAFIDKMAKLLLSTIDADRQIAYEALIGRYYNIERINRALFEKNKDILLVDAKKAGLISYTTVLPHKIGIVFKNETGGNSYKYI